MGSLPSAFMMCDRISPHAKFMKVVLRCELLKAKGTSVGKGLFITWPPKDLKKEHNLRVMRCMESSQYPLGQKARTNRKGRGHQQWSNMTEMRGKIQKLQVA